MTEVFTQKKTRFIYERETAYGEQVAAPDQFLMHFLGYDTKSEQAWEPVQTLDGNTKDIEDFIQTTEAYQLTVKGRPIHGVPLGYIWGDDWSGNETTFYSHSMQNLVTEVYDLPSFTSEVAFHHTTGHTPAFAGCKVMSAELTAEGGKPIELSIDVVAQSMDSDDDTGASWETTDARGKYYAPSTKRPFDFGDCEVELQGTAVNPLKARLKVENNLDIVYGLDDSGGRTILEPLPARRTYEFEVTARMADDTYFDLWDAKSTIGTTTGLAINDVDGITAADTSITYDGTASPAGSVSTVGLLKIGSEYILYRAKSATVFSSCVRGVCGSTAATHLDNAGITLYGNVNFQINRGTNDSIYFLMWGGVLNAYSDPIDVGGDIVQETLTYRPAKCVPVVVDDIGEDYVNANKALDS